MRTFPQALTVVFVCLSSIPFAAQLSPRDNSDSGSYVASDYKSAAAVQLSTVGHLTLIPLTLSFPNTVVGSSSSKRITLSASNGPVTIASKQINNSEFSISGLALPLTLASGQSLQITVRFKPQSPGLTSGKLSLLTRAGTVSGTDQLSGTGVAATAHKVSLNWTADVNPVIGYNVYRGTQSAGPYARINTALEASTNYIDPNVKSGATYYYAATAVNSKGLESGYSAAIKVVIPSP